MTIKVCGMKDIAQLEQLDALGINYAGLIFYEKSPRFVGTELIGESQRIKKFTFRRVGVFVNASVETIQQAVKNYGLDYVQLHGDESVAFCKEVQRFIPVIKAIRIGPNTDIEEEVKKYETACTYFLFDTDSAQYGGGGKLFDWNRLQTLSLNKPFFLSGGIGLEQIEALKIFSHPQFLAVDVNSRFEKSPGVKDIEQVKKFKDDLK